jgi:hypothetical protein
MVRVTEHTLKLVNKCRPPGYLWVSRPKLNIAMEVSLCHAVKVLNGIENVGLLSGIGVMLHVEYEVAFEEEIMELRVVFTTEGCWGFGITFFGLRWSWSWSGSGLLEGLEGWEKAQDEGLVVGPHDQVDTCGSQRHNGRRCILRLRENGWWESRWLEEGLIGGGWRWTWRWSIPLRQYGRLCQRNW